VGLDAAGALSDAVTAACEHMRASSLPDVLELEAFRRILAIEHVAHCVRRELEPTPDAIQHEGELIARALRLAGAGELANATEVLYTAQRQLLDILGDPSAKRMAIGAQQIASMMADVQLDADALGDPGLRFVIILWIQPRGTRGTPEFFVAVDGGPEELVPVEPLGAAHRVFMVKALVRPASGADCEITYRWLAPDTSTGTGNGMVRVQRGLVLVFDRPSPDMSVPLPRLAELARDPPAGEQALALHAVLRDPAACLHVKDALAALEDDVTATVDLFLYVDKVVELCTSSGITHPHAFRLAASLMSWRHRQAYATFHMPQWALLARCVLSHPRRDVVTDVLRDGAASGMADALCQALAHGDVDGTALVATALNVLASSGAEIDVPRLDPAHMSLEKAEALEQTACELLRADLELSKRPCPLEELICAAFASLPESLGGFLPGLLLSTYANLPPAIVQRLMSAERFERTLGRILGLHPARWQQWSLQSARHGGALCGPEADAVTNNAIASAFMRRSDRLCSLTEQVSAINDLILLGRVRALPAESVIALLRHPLTRAEVSPPQSFLVDEGFLGLVQEAAQREATAPVVSEWLGFLAHRVPPDQLLKILSCATSPLTLPAAKSAMEMAVNMKAPMDVLRLLLCPPLRSSTAQLSDDLRDVVLGRLQSLQWPADGAKSALGDLVRTACAVEDGLPVRAALLRALDHMFEVATAEETDPLTLPEVDLLEWLARTGVSTIDILALRLSVAGAASREEEGSAARLLARLRALRMDMADVPFRVLELLVEDAFGERCHDLGVCTADILQAVGAVRGRFLERADWLRLVCVITDMVLAADGLACVQQDRSLVDFVASVDKVKRSWGTRTLNTLGAIDWPAVEPYRDKLQTFLTCKASQTFQQYVMRWSFKVKGSGQLTLSDLLDSIRDCVLVWDMELVRVISQIPAQLTLNECAQFFAYFAVDGTEAATFDEGAVLSELELIVGKGQVDPALPAGIIDGLVLTALWQRFLNTCCDLLESLQMFTDQIRSDLMLASVGSRLLEVAKERRATLAKTYKGTPTALHCRIVEQLVQDSQSQRLLPLLRNNPQLNDAKQFEDLIELMAQDVDDATGTHVSTCLEQTRTALLPVAMAKSALAVVQSLVSIPATRSVCASALQAADVLLLTAAVRPTGGFCHRRGLPPSALL
jgi:hypothetical protein